MFSELYCVGVVCQNAGTCVEVTGDYRCDCVPGYDGRNCEDGIPETSLLHLFCLLDIVCVLCRVILMMYVKIIASLYSVILLR